MPPPRLRPLIHSILPGAVGALGAAAALAAIAVDAASSWRGVVATTAALASAGGALWLRQLAAHRRWAAREFDTGSEGRPPRKRPERSTPASAERDVLAEVLCDVRDAMSAREAIFWRLAPDGEGLVVGAAAGGKPSASMPRDSATLGVIAWSAQERLTQYTTDMHGAVGAAPVLAHGVLLGALSVHGGSALPGAHDDLRARLTRAALHVGDVADLIDTRLEFDRQSRHSQQLLAAAREFQQLRSPRELARALCTTALGITGDGHATLVRWKADEGVGAIDYSTMAACHPAQPRVTAASLVGTVCQEALPGLWEDSRRLDPATSIFGEGEPPRGFQSLGIVPVEGRSGVIGALVIEGRSPGSVRPHDMRTVRLLAALASVSMETLDDFEASERRAHIDQLTGLPNRRAFEARFGAALDRADRFGEPVAVIRCDVDEFKAVNDAHGHEAGDAVLRSIGATLQRGIRAVDVWARHGGEEFIALLPRTSRVGAVELAERLRRAIELRPIRVSGHDVSVSASFGVAIYPATVTSRDDLVTAAGRALYQAKRDGRNCVRCADATAVFD